MIEDLIKAAASGDYDSLDMLEAIAAESPERLTSHFDRMLDLSLLWPPTLYRSATGDIVRRIVERVDSGEAADELNHLLLILSHTRDPLAEAALRRWHTSPPTGMNRLNIGSLDYARQGGWTLHPDGTRRELCTDIAYQLILQPVPQPADRVACPWCESPLWTVVDLDPSQPEIAEVLGALGWPGRLRITTCFLCANYTTLYSQVTPDGGTAWSPRNVAPSYLQRSTEDPPALIPVIGQQRASAFLASAWNEGGSTLGGHPQWIQDAEHVDCANCGQPMDYLGLIGGADLGFGEGAYYVQLHAPCGLAAVCYQQS